MSSLGKLSGIAALAKMLLGNVFYRRALTGIGAAVGLGILSCMTGGIALLAGCYAAYIALVQHGIDTDIAALIIAGALLLVTLILVMLTIRFIHKLRNALLPLPSTARLNRIADAFMDGLMTPQEDEKR